MSGRFRVADGKCAIWTDASDDAPFSDPTSNLARVKYHSDLAYVKVIQAQVVNVNLSARSGGPGGVASYTLFAHGLTGYPFVFGKVFVGGEPVAFTGSIPIQRPSANDWYARWLALGADATNVYLHEYWIAGGNPGNWETYSALSLDVEVYVTDEILEV